MAQTLKDGAALVTFSGDKLLGGPQAGIIAGRKDLVDSCGRHPLARALRPGSLVLNALQDVALSYLRRDVAVRVPLWQMAIAPLEELKCRAHALGVGEVVECDSVMGAGPCRGWSSRRPEWQSMAMLRPVCGNGSRPLSPACGADGPYAICGPCSPPKTRFC